MEDNENIDNSSKNEASAGGSSALPNRQMPNELLTEALEYIRKQKEKEKMREERRIKKRIISKIKERLRSADESKLMELETTELGTLSRLLRKIEYHEPKFPLDRYSAFFESALRYRWVIIGSLAILAVALIVRGLIG